jgi:N6-L-threonylcarbamoyladenine synthase
MAGGVAANSALREAMEAGCKQRGITLYYPSPILCTDNAAMIGAAAYYEFLRGTRHGLDLNAIPNLKIGQR